MENAKMNLYNFGEYITIALAIFGFAIMAVCTIIVILNTIN
jgi:hypothetical protein